MLLFSNRVTVYLEDESRRFRWLARLTRAAKRWRARRWSGKTSQLNLVSYCLGKPDQRRLWLRVADKFCLGDIVDDLVFIRRMPLLTTAASGEGSLLDFVFHGLRDAAIVLKAELDDTTAGSSDGFQKIMKECGCRGERAIKGHENAIIKLPAGEDKLKLIMDSVAGREFDESLLLWHVATDLCRVKDNKATATPMTTEARLRPIGETLSEYMLYLLIKQPEMLSATAGIGLLRYRDTCAEARRFFASMDEWVGGDHAAARALLLRVNTSQRPATVKGDRSKSVLFDAVILAKALRGLADDELMWEVVAGVWGEMLTYAAGRCRGSTHVRQLSRGGELITLVWFLMAHMGLGDMYQIHEGDAKDKLIVHDQ